MEVMPQVLVAEDESSAEAWAAFERAARLDELRAGHAAAGNHVLADRAARKTEAVLEEALALEATAVSHRAAA